MTVSMADPVLVTIVGDDDIVRARREGRALAERLGCSATDSTLVATAISEVARNITNHAGRGEIVIDTVSVDGRRALEVVARDQGPGIADVDQAMEDGYTTGAGLGLGLPGARRLMDMFEITSEIGVGTTVVMRKWC